MVLQNHKILILIGVLYKSRNIWINSICTIRVIITLFSFDIGNIDEFKTVYFSTTVFDS